MPLEANVFRFEDDREPARPQNPQHSEVAQPTDLVGRLRRGQMPTDFAHRKGSFPLVRLRLVMGPSRQGAAQTFNRQIQRSCRLGGRATLGSDCIEQFFRIQALVEGAPALRTLLEMLLNPVGHATRELPQDQPL